MMVASYPRQQSSKMNDLTLDSVSTCIGRDRELALLDGCLASARSGAGRLVVIGGEAGIGKTTLVHAFAKRSRETGPLVLTGNCYDLEITPPYGPWKQILASYHALALSTDDRSLLLDRLEISDTIGKDELHAAVADGFIELAGRTPLVLIFEDQHWTDSATLDLLRLVSRRLAQCPMLVVVTYRDAELTAEQPLYRLLPLLIREANPLRLSLRPFGRNEIAHLVEGRYALERPDLERLVSYLMRNGEGNPLYMLELLSTLQEEEILVASSGEWRLGELKEIIVPPLIRQIIDGRLAHLSATTRELLQLASVLGTTIQLEFWEEVAGRSSEEMREAVADGIAAQILVRDPGQSELRFRHALIRQALYEQTPLPKLQEWHREAGERLADRPRPDPNDVAYHLCKAREPDAIRWLIEAGDRAQALYSPGAASIAYAHAIEIAQAHGDHPPIEALRGHGLTLAATGRFEAACSDLLQALHQARQVDDRPLQWRLLMDLATIWTERDYQHAATLFGDALSLAESIGEPDMIAHSQGWIGTCLLNSGKAVAAVERHEAALRIFEEAGNREGMAAMASVLAMDNLIRGDLISVPDRARVAIDLYRQLDDRHGLAGAMVPLGGSGGAYMFATEIPNDTTTIDAIGVAEEGMAIASAAAWLAGQTVTRTTLAAGYGVRGRYDRALPLAQEAYRIGDEIEHRQWMTLSQIVLGEIYLDLLAPEKAREPIESALRLAAGTNSYLHRQFATGALVRAHVALGDLRAAEALLDGALTDIDACESAPQRGCWRAYAMLLLAKGEGDRAVEIVQELIAATPNRLSHRLPPNLQLLQAEALAATGELDRAMAALDGTIATARHFQFRPVEWRALSRCARLFAQFGRPREAARARAERDEIIGALAELVPDPELASHFRQRALDDAAPAPERTESPNELSGRELEVLGLVAQGMTNAAIAEQLYISPSTVKRHLESIYSKLGVDTRTAAAAYAFERGLLSESAGAADR
jgi:ATP/maltotriose-dependent transcriptional regulator MalT